MRTRIIRPRRLAVLFGAVFVFTALQAAPPKRPVIDPWKGPSFSAEWITYFQGEAAHPEETSRILVSRKHGMRREMPPGGPFVEIVSYRDKQIYWVHLTHRIYTAVDERDTHTDRADEVSALVSEKPCEDFKQSEQRGEKVEDGRPLEIWHCRDPRYGRAVHFFDARNKLLIRDQFVASGWTNELLKIRLEEPPAALFQIPGGFSKVTRPEFERAWLRTRSPAPR